MDLRIHSFQNLQKRAYGPMGLITLLQGLLWPPLQASPTGPLRANLTGPLHALLRAPTMAPQVKGPMGADIHAPGAFLYSFWAAAPIGDKVL